MEEQQAPIDRHRMQRIVEQSISNTMEAAAYGQGRMMMAAIQALCEISPEAAKVKAAIAAALNDLRDEPMACVDDGFGSPREAVINAAQLAADVLSASCDRAEAQR